MVALEGNLAGLRHPAKAICCKKSGLQAVPSPHPGSLAFVMARAIIVIAFHLHGLFEIG